MMKRLPLDFDKKEISPDPVPEPTVRDMSAFKPRRTDGAGAESIAKAIDRVSDFPERETEAQINIRASSSTLERFKECAWRERKTYASMLKLLLDTFEAEKKR